mgnify:CR=1 FL=1
MRKPLIAGNWKMNTTKTEANTISKSIVENNKNDSAVELVIIPPFTYLETVYKNINQTAIKLGAQNVNQNTNGAYTGEISITMLNDMNCDYVVIGHSERRQYFNESNEETNQKVLLALNHNITPILCVGESLEERETNKTLSIIENQLKVGLKHIEINSEIVIAYEPIWAIGTGKVATPEQAQEVHTYIRQFLANLDQSFAEKTRILYGGSVKPENISNLITKNDIDGALVGGASLDATSFLDIAKNCIQIKTSQ